ncbi:hypothetical protein VSS74_16770 [Conexibacter stalactiti]|uniref:Secreted protein n=1 Tax=Conexibacter stalactiti TaxID=1940611 RepID=A0ABU4HRS3_9ACTN|nr:hypothetical protein [Conexibacter stalactiti]MDW5596005.1 hypothetical protein [Conexibacter stalactiti]MEC5036647.1 hypothetical protein [Conexibacter stalactiti]
MFNRSRLASVVAATALALVGSTATASAHDAIGITPSGPLPTTIGLNTQAGGITFSAGMFVGNCTMTLDLIFHPVIRKVLDAPVGAVTNGSLVVCNPPGVTASILGLPNPSPITYDSFLGTLPNITGLLVWFRRLSFQFNVPGTGLCLYSGQQGALIDFTKNPRTVTLLAGGIFTKQAGSPLACPAGGTLTTGPPMLLVQPVALNLIDD